MIEAAAIDHPFPEPPVEGAAIEIAPGVLWMRLPLPMKLDHVNVYALDDGDGWTLVDTGFDTRRGRAIWRALLSGPLAGKPVARVLVTHHHPDHVGLAGWFKTDHGAQILTSRTAWLFARMLQLDEQSVPTPETLAFWRACGMAHDIYERRAAERPFNFADCVAPIPAGYTRLSQGDTLRAGGRVWDVHMGDGHAPDHVTLWSRSDALVIGGDQLLPSISPNIGVHATEPEADPVGAWLDACARLAPLARPDHLVLCGHKTPFVGLPQRMRQLADNHHGALARLYAHLVEPKSAGDCFLPLFRREIGEGEYGLALSEAMAHCLHLWHSGQASRDIGADGVWRFEAL